MRVGKDSGAMIRKKNETAGNFEVTSGFVFILLIMGTITWLH